MFKQYLMSHPRLLTRLFYAAVVALALLLAVPVAADYIGPQRSSTELVQVRDPDNDVWTMIHVDPNDQYADVCLIIHTCEQHPSIERQQALCGWDADDSSCEMAYRWEERVITLPEATISADLQGCNAVNGWCTAAASLHLQGSEPLSGEIITGIEGVRSGITFFAPGDTADVPLLEGSNTFSYWALSSYGDSSRMGEQIIGMDTTAPDLAFSSPAAGAEFWHNGPLTFSGTGQDAASGLAQVELSFDGGNSWQTVSLDANGNWSHSWDSGVMPDGSYLVLARASDHVGNQQISSWATVHVDHSLPWVDLPARWMIWEELPLRVGAGGCGLESVHVTIHGGSYGLRKFSFNNPTSWLPAAISWDRKFGQVTAPVGEYRVTVAVRDRMGNNVSGQTMLVIPDPAAQVDANALIPNTGQDETRPYTAEDDTMSAADYRRIAPAQAEAGYITRSSNSKMQRNQSKSQTGLTTAAPGSSGAVLWGVAGSFMAAGAVAYGLSRRKKRAQILAQARKAIAKRASSGSMSNRLRRIWKAGQRRATFIRNAILSSGAAHAARQILRKPVAETEQDVLSLHRNRLRQRVVSPPVAPAWVKYGTRPPLIDNFIWNHMMDDLDKSRFRNITRSVWNTIARDSNLHQQAQLEHKLDLGLLAWLGYDLSRQWRLRSPLLNKAYLSRIMAPRPSAPAFLRQRTRPQYFSEIEWKLMDAGDRGRFLDLSHGFWEYLVENLRTNKTAVIADTFDILLRTQLKQLNPDGLRLDNPMLDVGYGKGQDGAWKPQDDHNIPVAQNLVPSYVADIGAKGPHNNLCGPLAVMAALGLTLQQGLRLFAEIKGWEPGADMIWRTISGTAILSDPSHTTSGATLRNFIEAVRPGSFQTSWHIGGDPSPADLIARLKDKEHLIALVNIDTIGVAKEFPSGIITPIDSCVRPAAHWVTILDVINPPGLDSPLVRVYNPYMNVEELYDWRTFRQAWQHTRDNTSQYGLITARPIS